MSEIHIDEFFHDATKVLVSLYSMFPRPVTLYAEDICGPDEPDEYGVHGARFQACFATLVWLGNEGYIEYADTIGHEAVDQAVLTGSCFASLLTMTESITQADAALPESVARHQKTLIYQLQQALSSRSSEATRTVFERLLELMSGPN